MTMHDPSIQSQTTSPDALCASARNLVEEAELLTQAGANAVAETQERIRKTKALVAKS